VCERENRPSIACFLPVPTKVFTALDVSDPKLADRLVDKLFEANPSFKVGLELFIKAGPDWVKRLVERDSEVFLDLKFHDIPNTVAQAVTQAVALGVHSTNIHLLGGEDMARAAVDACGSARTKFKRRTKLLGVTILTSTDSAGLKKIGIQGALEDRVLSLAAMAKECGLDGVVCSAHEVKAIKKICGSKFLTMVPGIRPAWAAIEKDDQSRVMTPLQAAREGADFLVIGRPIIKAPKPADALREILDSL
jgi:orotidine-5'-phosphate decarboxylase